MALIPLKKSRKFQGDHQAMLVLPEHPMEGISSQCDHPSSLEVIPSAAELELLASAGANLEPRLSSNG